MCVCARLMLVYVCVCVCVCVWIIKCLVVDVDVRGCHVVAKYLTLENVSTTTQIPNGNRRRGRSRHDVLVHNSQRNGHV